MSKVNKEESVSEVLSEREQVKQNRFTKNAGRRAYNVIKELNRLQNCANKASYSYTSDQVAMMLEKIAAAYNALVTSFDNKLGDVAEGAQETPSKSIW